MKLKQSLLILSLVVLGALFAACGGGGTPAAKVTLTVNKAGSGSGTVTSEPAGITATKNSAQFDKDKKVVLTATPDTGSTFAGWSGGGCTGTGTCTVTLSAATTVTATFNKESGGGSGVNTVTLNKQTLALQVGSTEQLTATVDPASADQSVTWSSDNEAVATVDANGMVTAKAEGEAVITATSVADDTKSASATVTVTTQPPAPSVNSVTINEADQKIGVGGTMQLTVTVDVTGGADDSVTWTSSDPTVASVDENTGVVTGVKAGGPVTITATSTADTTKSDTVQVTVVDATVAEFPVIASDDDAEQFIEKAANASFPLNSTSTKSGDLDITSDINANRGNQLVGLRFQNVTIPKGATIKSAHIQFVADTSTTGAVAFTIKGQAADNASAFVDYPANNSTSLNNISGRATTTASAAWSPPDWTANASGAAQQTSDITAIVQEIVNRAGWTSGNALAVIISGDNRPATRVAKAFDKTPAAAPVLVVTY